MSSSLPGSSTSRGRVVSQNNNTRLLREIVEHGEAGNHKEANQTLQMFRDIKFTDILLPFPESGKGLPVGIRGDSAKLQRLIIAQRQLLVSNGSLLDDAVEEEHLEHMHVAPGVVLEHFFGIPSTKYDEEQTLQEEYSERNTRFLGKGGFSIIFAVRSKKSNESLALKISKRPRGSNLDHAGEQDYQRFNYPDTVQEFFQVESSILRRLHSIQSPNERLKHISKQHVIRIKASFTDPHVFGLLLSPVAICDLEKVLLDCSPSSPSFTCTEGGRAFDKRETLQTFFGCLAAAVLFLHQSKVRHRDLKPKNVLITYDDQREGDIKVCICDFSAALDFSETHNPETNWAPAVATEAYISPEKHRKEVRNLSEDMHHLGRILLEISIVLMNKTRADLIEFISGLDQSEGSEEPIPIHKVMCQRQDIRGWLHDFQSSAAEASDLRLDWIENLVVSYLTSCSPPATSITAEVHSNNIPMSLAR